MSLSHLFFLLSVATLPIQLNKFFFLSHSYVLGIPIDYRAPSLYLSEIFIILTVLSTLRDNRHKLIQIFEKNKGFIVPLSLFALYLLVNSMLFSTDKAASIFYSAKIIELALYSIAAVILLGQKNILDNVKMVLKFTIAWQGAIAILQFALQKSLGLNILGERAFDVTTVQIAHASVLGTKFLRSYGTFPHPNVLAAFLVISAAVSNLGIHISPKATGSKTKFTRDNALTILAALAVLVTFSKTALVLGLLFIIFKINGLKKRALTLALALATLIIYLRYFTQTYIETVAERLSLTEIAINMSRQNLTLGVGSNNFIPHLAGLNLISIGQVRLLQPVHNIFLLILAENGIIGLALLTIMLVKVAEKATKPSSIFLSLAIIIYLSVDHFLWTLHQGQMLFFLTIALIYSSKKKP